MKPLFYILKNKNPIPAINSITFAKYFEKANRHVADTKIGKIRVSTVFLGLDHQFGEGPPILFETMVFGGRLDGQQNRYYTWTEAEKGHDEMVKFIKKNRRTK
jgi:hypothetical protein